MVTLVAIVTMKLSSYFGRTSFYVRNEGMVECCFWVKGERMSTDIFTFVQAGISLMITYYIIAILC